MSERDHARTVEGFSYQWRKFDQSPRPQAELRETFRKYFSIFPWDALPQDAVGFDLGCGTGRWARFVAPEVGSLYCVDASEGALGVAVTRLRDVENCLFVQANAGELPFRDGSMDFGYVVGVLHYLHRPAHGLRDAVAKLKPGAPMLLYVYYALENRSAWYRWLWRLSDRLRLAVSSLPPSPRYLTSQAVATLAYYPLARLALLCEMLGLQVDSFPLAAYRRRSFYAMRTDALDRLGSPLEKRFTKQQIRTMMEEAGLREIRFREGAPYWCAVGIKREGAA